MRKLIAGMKVSVDGKTEGPDGYADWVDAWSEDYGLTPQIDACLLGGRMYPGYEQYWTAIQRQPDQPLPMTGKLATPAEIQWARVAEQTPHYVLSNTVAGGRPNHGELDRRRAGRRTPADRLPLDRRRGQILVRSDDGATQARAAKRRATGRRAGLPHVRNRPLSHGRSARLSRVAVPTSAKGSRRPIWMGEHGACLTERRIADSREHPLVAGRRHSRAAASEQLRSTRVSDVL